MGDNLYCKRLLPSFLASLLLITLWHMTQPALADEEPMPATDWKELFYLEELEIELGVQSAFDTEPATSEPTDVYAVIEPLFKVTFGESFSLFTGVTLEPLADPTDDRVFGDMGLYIDRLWLSYETGNITLFAGKLVVPFALGWKETPTVFGEEFPEMYKLPQMISGGLTIAYDFAESEHSFTLTGFFSDTTILSEAIGENIGRLDENDGGVANTEGLDSFALQFAGTINGVAYNLSARQLAKGIGDAEDEKGISFGLSREFALGDNALTLMAEIADFEGFEGTQQDALYITGGATYTFDAISLGLAHTHKDTTDNPNDRQTSIGVEYAVSENSSIAVNLAQFVDGGDKGKKAGLFWLLGF